MSNDTVTTTTSQSWFSRIGSALMGVLVGIVLFLGSFLLLGWNEGRAIHRAKTLEIGAGQVVTVPADAPVAGNEGKLVHITGVAEADKPVKDPVFGIVADALKLRRDVEMYQWKEDSKSETKQKLGGGEETTTTYTYSKAWASGLIDSSNFKEPSGHKNPAEMPVDSETFVAPAIHVGKFQLPPSLTDKIDNYVPRPATEAEAKAAAKETDADIQTVTGGQLYVGADPGTPAVGDLRVTFKMAPSGPVSIVAKQIGDTFEEFIAENGRSIEPLLQTGTHSAQAMFQAEQEGNAMLTWILRLAGFLMMLFGLLLITGIFSVIASVIPFLGNIVNMGTGMLAFAVALPLTLVTIALAWLAYRPLIGIPLFLLAIGSLVFAIMRLSKRKKAA